MQTNFRVTKHRAAPQVFLNFDNCMNEINCWKNIWPTTIDRAIQRMVIGQWTLSGRTMRNDVEHAKAVCEEGEIVYVWKLELSSAK